MKWHRQVCAVLVLLLSRRSCFAAEDPVVPSPDFIAPKLFQTKDVSDGYTMSERDETSPSAIGSKSCSRGRNPSCSWGSTKEAIGVFKKLSPSSGGCEFRPGQLRSQRLPSLKSSTFAETVAIAHGKTILGNLSVPPDAPLIDSSRLKGPDADVTPPLVVGLVDGDGPPATEDMPSFNEWAKKRLEEQGHPSGQMAVKGSAMTAKKSRHKNYASVDCGAKVLAANAESQSASAVLSHDQDDYMLNPCTARAWLALELCEAVQLERLELANFELFSSSPRHFNVFSSDRYPTREWNAIGAFEAVDEKTAQSFSLQQTSFSKYIKVEMVSHYGAEHFCPLSLIRVYGTSEYEALDTEEQTPDDQSSSMASMASAIVSVVTEASRDYSTTPASVTPESKNLFGSAKEAVLTIVKKAAEALTSKNNSEIVDGREQKLANEVSSENCRCLQRVPNFECQMPAPIGSTADCNQTISERSLSLLACDYDRLNAMLHRLRPRHGHFVRTCSNACSAYVGGSPKNDTGRDALKCSFYAAALGSLRFGALCHLDKLMLDGDTPTDLPFVLSTKMCRTSVESTKEPSRMNPVSASEDRTADSDAVSVVTSSISSSINDGSPSATSIMETGISDGVVVVVTAKISDIDSEASRDSYRQIRPTPSIENEGGRETDVGGTQRIESSVGREDHLDGVAAADAAVASGQSIVSDAFVLSPAVQSEDSTPPTGTISLLTTSAEVSGSNYGMLEEPKLTTSQLEAQEGGGTSSTVIGGQSTLEVGNGSPLASNVVAFNDGHEALTHPVPISSSSVSNSNVTDAGKPFTSAVPGGITGGSLLTPAQKESVFVRLSNRIKALELNMSLSSQYLEELSRRYRKQMEEMQRAFNKTISALNDTARMAHERDLRQQEMIGRLQKQFDALTKAVTSLAEQQEGLHSQVIARHLVLMMIEIVVMMALFLTCFRPGVQPSRLQSLSSAVVARMSNGRIKSGRNGSPIPIATPLAAAERRPSSQRRSSDSSLTGLSPSARRRRPSSEALNVSGTYSDLLIVEPTIPIWVDRPLLSNEISQARKSKRKKHRNKGSQGLYRSVSNDALALKPPVHPRAARKGSAADVSSAGLLFDDSPVSRIVNVPVRKNRDGGFESNAGWTVAPEEARTTMTTRGTAAVQLQRPPPPRQSLVVSKSRDVHRGSGCPLTLPLSCHQSFSLKETASLAASSLVYGCGSDKDRNG